MRIYVGNLSYDTTEDELRKDFSAFGEVASVSVVTDRYSGRSKGFAFVEMTNKAEADAAIAGLNGKSVKDRTLVVNEARPRTEGGHPVTREDCRRVLRQHQETARPAA